MRIRPNLIVSSSFGRSFQGHYGAFLLREFDLLSGIVSHMVAGLKECSVTCKIRLLDQASRTASLCGLQGTIGLCQRLQAAGASAICVHGRTRHNRGAKTRAADWEWIRLIKAHPDIHVPIIVNGNIETFPDVEACMRQTKCDGVMSCEAILSRPSLFAGAAGAKISSARLAVSHLFD